MLPPSPMPAEITDELDRDETEEENDRDCVFGIRLCLFELIAAAGSAADEGEAEVHPQDGANASQY